MFPSSQVHLPSLTPWVSGRLVRNLGTMRNMPTDSLDRPLGRIDPRVEVRGSGGDLEAGKDDVPSTREEEKQLSVSPLRETYPRLDFTFESASSDVDASSTASSSSFGPLITEGPILERADSSVENALRAPGTSPGTAVTLPRAPTRHRCWRRFWQEKSLPLEQPAARVSTTDSSRLFKADDVVEVTFDAHLRIEV